MKDNELEEISRFRESMQKMFHIEIALYSSDFKSEIQKLINEKKVQVIVMGNRRTDPWSKDLTYICPSSEDWPKFIRAFPILDWNY